MAKKHNFDLHFNFMGKKKNAKQARFEKVAAYRVQKVIDFLDSLSNCANKANYDYEEDQVRKMFKVIRDQLATTEAAFNKQLSKVNKESFKF